MSRLRPASWWSSKLKIVWHSKPRRDRQCVCVCVCVHTRGECAMSCCEAGLGLTSPGNTNFWSVLRKATGSMNAKRRARSRSARAVVLGRSVQRNASVTADHCCNVNRVANPLASAAWCARMATATVCEVCLSLTHKLISKVVATHLESTCVSQCTVNGDACAWYCTSTTLICPSTCGQPSHIAVAPCWFAQESAPACCWP